MLIIGFLIKTPLLIQIGIGLFSFAVVFHIITLPVEFDASKRALNYLKNSRLLSSSEYPKAKSVLTAAAMTYVASTMMAILQLVRMIILSDDE